ncbi:alpha/beta hydrolase [Kineosporia sp. J2-2]|uniref:Alpha/beta hydrolase n=1 Tax=Kineosporia corallincola TaxID=2835133 RepID=A0ABS5TBL7_9ACTN|nr:alpha/beta hydrolase [Kineosporia corallincola]MBT0768467.1 alpha/beta hydrolase [Kineosporia corallincola]
MTDHTLTLPDGRALELYTGGQDGGIPLVFHHGTPGSRLAPAGLEQAAKNRGLALVIASRAGYGGSHRKAGRSVVDVVDDTRAVLEFIGAEEFFVAGHSGGGPHALACAARLPGVRASLVIAGVAPYGVSGLDFLDGMGEENLIEFGTVLDGEPVARPYLEEQRAGLVTATAAGVIEALASVLPDVDRAVMTDAYGEELAAGMAEGLRLGVDGWLDDDIAFTRDWGFSLDEIAGPVTIWQGDLDLMVPFAHGRHLASAVPGADVNLLTGEGHLSIVVGANERMLDRLVALG